VNTPGHDTPRDVAGAAEVWDPSPGALLRCLVADVDRAGSYASDFSEHRTTPLRRLSNFLTPGVLCVAAYRIAHWLYRRGHERSARLLSWLNFVVHKAAIAPSVRIGPGLYVPHTVGVVFDGTAGRNLTLYYRSAVISAAAPNRRGDPAATGRPTLGDDVTIGVLSSVVGPVTIGSGTLIGARVAVTRDVPARSVVIDESYARRGNATTPPTHAPPVHAPGGATPGGAMPAADAREVSRV
jgi:serine O-acetyltransferase